MKWLIALLVPTLATMFVSVERYEEDYTSFENRIEVLESEQSECNLVEMLYEFSEALDEGYTFEFIDGILYEYKDGEFEETFTNEYIVEYYCKGGE